MSGGNFHVGPPGPLGGTIRRLCFSSLLCGPQRGRRTQRNNAGTAARAMPAYWTETVQKGKSDLNADGKRRNIIRTLVPKFGNFESDIRQHTCSMSRGAKSRQKTGNQPNSRLNPGVIPAPRADHFGNGIKTGAALAVFLQAAVVTHKFFFSRQHQPIPTLPSLLNSNAFHYSMPGEDRWFQPTVRNRLSQAVVLANLTIKLGKFYDISEHPPLSLTPMTNISLRKSIRRNCQRPRDYYSRQERERMGPLRSTFLSHRH